jgi:hypothetical protein
VPRLTLRQHHFFSPETTQLLGGKLVGRGAWDALRTNPDRSSFAIPLDRAEWRGRCTNAVFADRGAEIERLARQLGVSGITSFGVGTACVEYNIHRANPDLPLYLSDYSMETVGRLRVVFPEAASIEVVDLLRNEPKTVVGTLTMLHRIDTEFTNHDFRRVFMRLHANGHRLILLIPTTFLTLREFSAEMARRMLSRTGRRRATWTGYVRTRPVFGDLWSNLYRPVAKGSLRDAEYILLDRLA